MCSISNAHTRTHTYTQSKDEFRTYITQSLKNARNLSLVNIYEVNWLSWNSLMSDSLAMRNVRTTL